MAFTNSPENSTYRTIDLDFTATSWPRNTYSQIGRDPLIYNMYYDRNSNENQTKEFVLKKRDGLNNSTVSLNKTTSSDVINGVFQDTNSGAIYWSVNRKVYVWGGSTVNLLGTMGVPALSESYPNTVGFCLFLKSTGVRYLMINNGTELWYHEIGTSTMTKITDPDYPSLTQTSMVFLDGYLFVIKKDTGDIYNSDLDDPTSWTPGNYATAEINPDFSIVLAKVKNYLVCFGTDGIEFFYDAANPSGSPLGRNESYYQQISLFSSVLNVGDTLYFAGKEKNSSVKVYKLQNNSLQIVSTPWVERFLGKSQEGFGADYTIPSFRHLVQIFTGGHNFIFINTADTFGLVYDIEEGFWYLWSFGNTSLKNTLCGAVRGGSGFSDRDCWLFLADQSNISILQDSVYKDFGVNFTASYITQDYTGDTFNWKMCHRFGLHCDYPTLSAVSNAQISWSDDDGQTWSTPRNLCVTTNNPYITQLGRFRTRNWKIEYTDNYPFRMWGASMDINVGNI